MLDWEVRWDRIYFSLAPEPNNNKKVVPNVPWILGGNMSCNYVFLVRSPPLCIMVGGYGLVEGCHRGMAAFQKPITSLQRSIWRDIFLPLDIIESSILINYMFCAYIVEPLQPWTHLSFFLTIIIINIVIILGVFLIRTYFTKSGFQRNRVLKKSGNLII